MNGFSSHVTACFNRITNNPESFMLSMMSCNVSSQRFSPNSHLLTFHPKGRRFQDQQLHSRFYQPPNTQGSQCCSTNVLSVLQQSHNKYHSFISVTGNGPALLLFSWSVSFVVTPWQSINIITYIPVDRKKIKCCCMLLHKSCFLITADHHDE